MKPVPILIALISLTFVAGLVYWDWHHRRSPGALHPSHSPIAALSDASGCVHCHGEGSRTMQQACLVCHTDIHAQIEKKQSLHGRMKPELSLHCQKCHTDHGGSRLAMVSPRSFQLAGIADSNKFDHSQFVDFKLAGKHLEINCEVCHAKMHRPFMARGERRFIGASQECASCHRDVHEGKYGPDCLGCHGQAHPFKTIETFTHTDKFPLEKVHAIKECAKCHDKSGPTSVAALYKQEIKVRECVACHKDVHEGAMGPDCISCHGLNRPFNQVGRFAHTDDFPLIGAHGTVACIKCHEKSGLNSVASLRRAPQPVRFCSACHQSPHTKALITFVAGALHKPEGQSCEACHEARHKSFQSPAAQMPVTLHAGTGFPLDPPHEKAKCESCHADLAKRPALAKGPAFAATFARFYPGRSPEACEVCHKDPHGGQFTAAIAKNSCTSCHAKTHFTPNQFDLARHDKTAFPLTGSHRAVGCNLCHKPDENKIVEFVHVASKCINCHKDVHDGRFDNNHQPAVVNGKTDCARCHSTTSFMDITWTGKEHEIWAGYKLVGKHAKATCVACHGEQKPDSYGRTLGKAAKTCAACHADPHGGQFAKENATDCAHCHADTGQFTQTTFNHQRDSRFKLDQQHINLKCAQCHKTVKVDEQISIVRYRPLGTECKDCHGVMDVKPRGNKK